MTFDLAKFQQSKAYDLLMGLPLIVWFGYVGVIKVRPNLAADARALLADPGSLYLNLQFLAFLASVAFNCLTVYLIVVRTTPVRRSKGMWGRVFGFVGTFLGVAIQCLDRVTLPFDWQVLATTLIFAGSLGSVIVLARLGKSFAIMPEARMLVVEGPYAYARHPLYVAEMVTIVGSSMLFRQPWAGLLAAGVALLLTVRSYFEEQILLETYPEYAAYRARVKRFGFI